MHENKCQTKRIFIRYLNSVRDKKNKDKKHQKNQENEVEALKWLNNS